MANIPLVIAAGDSLSSPSTIGKTKIVGIQMPAIIWTDAPLTFEASIDGFTFFDVFRNGNEFTVPVQAGIFAKLDANDFQGVSLLRVRSGTADNPINQDVSAALVLVIL